MRIPVATLSLKKKQPAPAPKKPPKKSAPPPKPKGPSYTPPVPVQPIFDALSEWMPDLFDQKNPTPLEIGISKQLALLPSPSLGRSVKNSVALWCRRREYLLACVHGEHRIGLNGRKSELTPRHREFAAERLAAREPKPA